MDQTSLEALPFYSLSDSQLYSFLRLDKTDLLYQNSQLGDYISSSGCGLALNELSFSYVTGDEFNNKIRSLGEQVELSAIRLNIRNLNRNHRALYVSFWRCWYCSLL